VPDGASVFRGRRRGPSGDGDRLVALFDSALEALPNGPGGVAGDDGGDPLGPDPIKSAERIPTYSSDALIRLHQLLSELHTDDDRRHVARILRTYEPGLANLKTVLTFSLPACLPPTVALLDNFLEARGLKRIDAADEDDFKGKRRRPANDRSRADVLLCVAPRTHR
jgi:hypothetical protein